MKSRPAPLANEASDSRGVDVNLTDMSDSDFYRFMPPDAKMGVDRKQSPSSNSVAGPTGGPARHLNPDATVDARQQAAFHVSIGQADRAVQLLKWKINEGDQPDPFVFLDLLSLLHSLGLTTSFQQVRGAFNQLFAGRVGDFASFKDEGLGLESYPDVLTHISALWPAPQVVAWIEAAIFRNSQDAGSQGFDLAAFRDLLMLHGVALDLAAASLPERHRAIGPGQRASEMPGFSSQERTPAHALDLDLDLSGRDGDDHGARVASDLASELNFHLLPPLDPDMDSQKRRE